MSGKPLAGRGEFFAYHTRTNVNGPVVEVYLGPKDNPESEYVLAINKSLIPQLIATLRMAEEML